MEKLLSIKKTLLLIFACCCLAPCPPGYAPLGRFYKGDSSAKALLVYDKGIERLVLEPSFSGNAKDFGLVLPVPNRPRIVAAPEMIFQQLNNLTNPMIFGEREDEAKDTRASAAGSHQVKIIEQKDVGDFKVTVLTAGSAQALLEWLKDNNYQYHESDEENFQYYVAKGGFYFIALKVNMAKARVDENGIFKGKLSPIEFIFKTPVPMLPSRSMAGHDKQMTLSLYTLSTQPLYIPAVDVLFSRQITGVDTAQAFALLKYKPWNKWLVRMEVGFHQLKIEEDVILLTSPKNLTVNIGDPHIVDSHLHNPHFGIIKSNLGKEIRIK